MEDHPSQRYCTLYITNQVMAVKSRYIPFFTYNSVNIKKIEKKIKKVIEKARLTDVYLFYVPDQFGAKTYGICLKSFQKRRLKKILRYAHSANLIDFEKRKVLRQRFSGKMFKDKAYIEDYPQYIKTIKANEEANQKSFISRGHFNFLKSFGIPLYNFSKQHGNENIMVTRCWFKE